MLDFTHDASARSWVASANAEDTDFPLQNLPYARVARPGDDWRIGVAIGDQVLDLREALMRGRWTSAVAALLDPLARGELKALMAQPLAQRRALRQALFSALAEGSTQQTALQPALRPQAALQYALPCEVGDYTDFYAGVHHAMAVGKLFRPDNPLLPNYPWVPIGYHGRASSLVVSGTPVRRPWGQRKGPDDAEPVFAPSQRVDLELELGLWVAQGNALGEPVAIGDAEPHLFGVSLLNDWSARDIQPWEYQPLGPFLAKSFATTVSPWIVTWEALLPFRCPLERPQAFPAPLAYLSHPAQFAAGALDIELGVLLNGQAIAHSNARHLCWTPAQLLTHHTSNGCNLRPGDLLGTGTISGPQAHQAGSLLELTHGGRQPLRLEDGSERRFLLDGDRLALTGRAHRAGARSLGFGACEAQVLEART